MFHKIFDINIQHVEEMLILYISIRPGVLVFGLKHQSSFIRKEGGGPQQWWVWAKRMRYFGGVGRKALNP